MNRALVDRVANAVLYEGYILYPYRPSVKNRQRWTFGGLYPEPYCRETSGSEASSNRAECLVRGTADTAVEVVVRFLHLTERQVGEFVPPLAVWPTDREPTARAVAALRVGDRTFHTWQEAEELAVTMNEMALGALRTAPRHAQFTFPGGRRQEALSAPDGTIAGVLTREQQALSGEVEVSATLVGEGLYRLAATVRNLTPTDGYTSRDEALARSLVSAHTLLGVRSGEFVSLFDPPDECRKASEECRNSGVWPVLVGEVGRRDLMLAAPIILYDYPQLAPESPGDLFDGTEIDEILSLRILTLTDDEKRAVAAIDDRARALLARTEALSADELFGLHGTIRRPPTDTGVSDMTERPLECVHTGRFEIRAGTRVRLRPRGRADIMDLALAGMAATVESIERDFEGRVYLAVTVDDDPGKDLGALRQPGHRFFFSPEEVEPLS
jgi:hypothetical protein